jgi:hypothetical protein
MALVNPNIAMSFRQPEFTPRNALAEYAQIQQIQGGQRQAEVADMQLAQMRQKEKAISDIQAKAAQGGGPTDRRAIARAYIQSGNPEFMQFGLTMETTLDELDAFQNIMGGGRSGATAAPAAPAAEMGLPAGAQPPGDFTSTEAMGRVPGVVTSPIPDSPPMNALAPTPPAPTNALANPVAALRAKRDQLIALGTPRAIQAARSMDADIALMSKTTTASPGASVIGPDGNVIFTAPERPLAPPSSVAEFERAKTDPAFMQFLQERAAAIRPPRPEAAPRTQQVTMGDGAIGIMNMDTGAITPATMAGAPVKGKSSKELAVSEQQASYNIGRILDAAKEINAAIKKDPSALKPGVGEAAAASVGLSGTANVARNAQRQIVFGAQRDALDAMLYLATGAAYNKEQLEGQMAAYVPAFTDKPDAVEAKRTRMLGLIQNAKVRAGKAWTPEMDAASQVLFQPIVSGGKPAASGATGGWSVVK